LPRWINTVSIQRGNETATLDRLLAPLAGPRSIQRGEGMTVTDHAPGQRGNDTTVSDHRSRRQILHPLALY
jgi:hypothetical protein